MYVFVLGNIFTQVDSKRLSKLIVHEKGVWAKEIKSQQPRIAVRNLHYYT